MSINALSALGGTTQNNSSSMIIQALLSLLSGNNGINSQNLNSIFNTSASSSLLGANSNSIFGTANKNGLLSTDFQPVTMKEETMMSDLYSSTVSQVLNTKIPPLPEKAGEAKTKAKK